MPHEDGAAYAPVVATVSLGASCVLDVYGKEEAEEAEQEAEVTTTTTMTTTTRRGKVLARILQEPRSLLVTRGEAYEGLLHGIADVKVDEDLRPENIANWDLLGEESVFLHPGDSANGVEGAPAGGRNVRGTRISLTFRDVLKVKTMRIGVGGGSMLGKMGGKR